MSLTSYVKEESVRERIDESFPNRGVRAQKEIEAEPQTNHYALVGTAVDYLARFELRRNTPNVQSGPWVAEISLELAREHFPGVASDVRDAIDRAKDERDEYLETGTMSRSLVESSLDLARIDGIYRGGRPPEDLGEYDEGDIEDCLRLMEVFDGCDALDGNDVYLNPEFGLASRFVGGADADIILDGKLIDFKVTGKATFKVGYWRQLVGYLVLADAHTTLHESGIYDKMGLGDDPEARPLPDIDEIGVYFARHGEFSSVPADAVYGIDGYREFGLWFVKSAMDKYEPFNDGIRNSLRTLF